MRRIETLMIGGLSGLMVLSGCAQPPVGDRSGRVSPSHTTPPEAADSRPLVADFIEYSDQISAALMRDMMDNEQLAPLHSDRTTVLYGDIKNETGIVSTNDFEVVRERTKNRLMQSRTFNSEFRLLTSRQRLEELQTTELGGDLFEKDASGRVRNPRIHPDDTLLLNGTMYRISRGSTNYYLMTFELVRFSDGEIVWTNDYETKRW